MSFHPVVRLAAKTLLCAAYFSSFVHPSAGHAASPATIAGVMTRWQTTGPTACEATYNNYANEPSCPRDLMFTITPDLDGMSLQSWVSALVNSGVNTGVIYVMPSETLEQPANQTISDTEWNEYNQYIYLPPAALTSTQKQVILQVGEAISQQQYTVTQRDTAIIDFLQTLQTLYPVTTPMKFILDERVWFINHLDAKGVPILFPLTNPNKPPRNLSVFTQEHEYSADLSGIIQTAVADGLDQWLTGVRLSEYASKDWNLMGPVMVDMVTEINSQTSDWMKSHLFIGAGGGWGQDWEGVNAMQCPTTTGWQFPACTGAFPFAKLMNAQAGWFAFGDKFMEFGKPESYKLNGQYTNTKYTYITGEIIDFCAQNTANYKCQNASIPTVTDWTAFFEDDVDGLGFSDLIAFMNANAAAYPTVANVIFDGDNSDSVATLMEPTSRNGGTALATLFSNAEQGKFQNVETGANMNGSFGTWTGKIFLDSFEDASGICNNNFFGDKGLSMFQTNYNGFLFAPAPVVSTQEPNTMVNWSTWP